MEHVFDERQPIYQQLMEWITNGVLSGELPEETAVPSLRQVSAQWRINPLTVQKSYQELQQRGILQRRRGLGFFVVKGARALLREQARRRFRNKDWPALLGRAELLGFSRDDLRQWLSEEDNND